MSTAGAHAWVLGRVSSRSPNGPKWPGGSSRWPCILLICSSSSCALRRSSNRSQLVMTVMSFSLVHLAGPAARRLGKKCNSSERHSLPSNSVHCIVDSVHGQAQRQEANMANRHREAADSGPHTLWFSPPDGDDRHRRALTRERVVAEALTIIGADGVE